MSRIFIVGAGGVGSWLTALLVKTNKPENITIVDGDVLEKKNLDRQLFPKDAVGKHKAEALADLYDCEYVNDWFKAADLEINPDDWIMACVDNHAARMNALMACDDHGCMTIVGANETFSAEAYVYLPPWRGTELDPRVYYPEMLGNEEGDPTRTGAGCITEYKEKPQLATANFMAAALQAQMLTIWRDNLKLIDRKARGHLPFKLVSNFSKLESFKVNSQLKDNNNE